MSAIKKSWIACIGVSVLTAGLAWAETPEEEISQSRTVSTLIVPGKAEQPVPNSSLKEMDIESLEKVFENWKKLLGRVNKSHRRAPLPTTPTDFSQITPWAAPSVTSATEANRGGATNPLRVDVNSTPSTVNPGSSSVVNEPSVAAAGDYVFYTANWFAAASTDGGTTWSLVNPFTGPFADPPGARFCCDQQAHYDPASNSIFWLQQMIPNSNANEGVQRVNVDQDANGTWDCHYDVTAVDAGFTPLNLADYPDFSVSAGNLFVTSNVFRNGGGFIGAFVARLPLAEITTCAPATVDFHTETGFGSFRTTQGAGDTMYFADHETTQSLRVWSWPDADANATFVSRATTPWSNAGRSCPDPNGRNWCGSIDSRLFGAALAGDNIAFFWTPAQNPSGGFPFPYSQGIVLDTSDSLAVVDQPLIWSDDAAWTYPSLAGNSQGGFGGTVLWGGGTHFTQCSAFLADSVNSFSFNPLEHETVTAGTSGPSINRSGDYLGTRVYSPNDRIFAGSCFEYQTTTAGTSRYLLFGRDLDFNGGLIFEDTFDSGGTGNWSSVSP
ncbi:MAG: hypothetical protein AAF725_05615 [Acidobacteriota bacterium]